MSNPSALGAICYEAEASWGEDAGTYATFRLPALDAVDASGLEQSKEPANRVMQYRSAGSQHVLMTMGGSFSMKLDLTGHGSTMVGSPSVEQIETFLGIVFGNNALSLATSDTLGVSPGTAAVPITTGASGVSAGGLVRIGALGDGDGDGQFYAVGTHSGNNLTLLGAMNGAGLAGAVVYPSSMIYPSSSPTAGAITGTRFLLQTANLQYECHGCYPTAVAFSGLNTGERPQITITWGVSWWEYSTATFPSTVTSDLFNPAPVAAGSFNVQTVGTTTRNARTMRGFSLDYTLGVVPLMGPGGVNAYQKVVGAVRTNDAVKVSWTEDADAATTTPVLPVYGTATNSKYVTYTLSTTNGSAVGFFFPKVCVSNVATQKADGDINRLTITADAYSGDTTSSAVTLAQMIMGWA